MTTYRYRSDHPRENRPNTRPATVSTRVVRVTNTIKDGDHDHEARMSFNSVRSSSAGNGFGPSWVTAAPITVTTSSWPRAIKPQSPPRNGGYYDDDDANGLIACLPMSARTYGKHAVLAGSLLQTYYNTPRARKRSALCKKLKKTIANSRPRLKPPTSPTPEYTITTMRDIDTGAKKAKN